MWLSTIFNYLSFKDFVSCSKVCKTWREATQNPDVLKIAVPLPPSDLYLVSSQFLLEVNSLTFINPISERAFFTAEPFLANLEKLDLRDTSVLNSFMERLYEHIDSFLSLRLIDIRNCPRLRDFRPIQKIAQHYPLPNNAILVRVGNNRFSSVVPIVPSTITFCNDSPENVELYWLNFVGKITYSGSLEAGQSATKVTPNATPWIVMRPGWEGRPLESRGVGVVGVDDEVCVGVHWDDSGCVLMRVAAMEGPQLVRISQTLPFSLVPVKQALATAEERVYTKITIHNKTTAPLYLSYIGTKGEEQASSVVIPADDSEDIHTYETVPWIFRSVLATQEAIYTPHNSMQSLSVKTFGAKLQFTASFEQGAGLVV